MFEEPFKTMFLGPCFLIWDCFVVQIIIIQRLSSSALRAMTVPESKSAVMLFVVIIKRLKLCDVFHDFDCFPKTLPLVLFSSLPKVLPLG